MGVQETKQATQNMYRLLENLGTRLNAARNFKDPNLTLKGLQETQQAMADRSRQTATMKAQKLLSIAKAGNDFAQSRLDEARPKVDPNDIASLTRAAQAWQMVVEPALSKGQSWFDIASVADPDTLAALSRFGEQRIKLDDPHGAPVIISNLHNAIDQRLADVHPDEDARQLFGDAKTAQTHLSLAQALANATDSQRPQQVQDTLTAAKSWAYGNGVALPRTPRPTLAELDRQVHQPEHAPTSVD